MKIVFCLIVFMMSVAVNVSAYDIDLNNKTFYGEKFGNDYTKSLKSQKIKLNNNDYYFSHGLSFIRSVDDNGVQTSGTRIYFVQFINWNKKIPRMAPKGGKVFKGTVSHGLKENASYESVIKEIKKSDFPYQSFRGKWCFYWDTEKGQDLGRLLVVKLDEKWTAEINFIDDKLTLLAIYGNPYEEILGIGTIQAMELVESRP